MRLALLNERMEIAGGVPKVYRSQRAQAISSTPLGKKVLSTIGRIFQELYIFLTKSLKFV
jgi:hypothetical protein